MNTHLNIESVGQGPDIVLLHGWGMHGGVWQEIVAGLQDNYRLHCVDLPGHGRSRKNNPPEFTLPDLVDRIASAVNSTLTGPACWVGWSLGGMVAAHLAAEHPELVSHLVMVSASLRFCQADDWPHAVTPEVLEGFVADLQDDHRAILQRFLALQVSGEDQARETLRRLKQRIMSEPEPIPEALQSGLAILRDSDLRTLVDDIQQPILLIGGEKDRLVSPQALTHVASLLPTARQEVLAGAGHAPFISQPDRFIQIVKAFCNHAE